MDEKNTKTWDREDRDLLIELRTEMRGVRIDLKRLSDGNDQRLTVLEAGKLDRTEYNRLQADSLTLHTDFEKRLRTLEDDSKIFKTQIKVWLAVAGSTLGIGQIAIQLAINYFLK